MITTVAYLIFCYTLILKVDDNGKWTWKDYLIFIFSPIIVPAILGKSIAENGVIDCFSDCIERLKKTENETPRE